MIYGETPYRWFIMISYCLCSFANGFQWVTFSAIASKFGYHYDLESWKVNMFSLIYMIVYPFVCLPEGHLIDNYSTRLGIILAAFCTILAGGLKLLINKSIIWCYIGQFMASLFQPAILNSPGKISANWFREDIRTLICTICCLSNSIGVFVGFLWNLMFIDENEENSDKYKSQVFYYLLSECILSFVFCFPSFFISKNKPDISPSPSQGEDSRKSLIDNDQNNNLTLRESIKLLFTNKRFIYLLISTLFIIGYYNIMGTIINPLFELYSISGKKSSIIYFVSNILGMISSVIISKIVDKTNKFKLAMIILCVSGTVFQICLTLFLELFKNNEINSNIEFIIGIIFNSLVTIVVIPFYTIGMNYACEITYPVGESINGGIMMSVSQISGIAGTFLCDYFITYYTDKKWITNLILSTFFGIACIFVFLFDNKLARHEVDSKVNNI